MNMFKLIIAFSAATLYMQAASAYEIQTHGNLSEAAYDQSGLNKDAQLLQNFGLKSSDTFLNSQGPAPRTIKELIQDGARFEDDSPRPANHFFDPVHNKALTVGGATLGMKSPDWALEDVGIIGNQASSYRDARQYLYDALTSLAQTDRDKNFGLTFQTLGQVIHHIQDMAQPQHVRNDDHCDRWYCALAGMYNPSLYEKYTDQNRNNLPYTGYNSVMFPTARQFWTGGMNGNGQGMADFTNRNFVSSGTNFTGALAAIVKNPNYPSPDGTGAILTTRQITDADLLGANQPLNGEIDFIGTPVVDSYRGGASGANFRTSSYSLFDADLSIIGANKIFTLNRFNFDAAHQLLIPRAVAYSAGLIDYFFRGKIDFVPDTVNAGSHIIKNLGPEAMTGTFTLYYDAVDGKRYPVAGDTLTETWAGRTIAANGQLDNLSFTPPTNSAPKNAGEYMLVFKGDMGEEKALNGTLGAVAAKFIQPGATDYVAMAMPNPVPYRSVFFYTAPASKNKVFPYFTSDQNDTNPWAIKYPPGSETMSDYTVIPIGGTWPWGDPCYNGGTSRVMTVVNSTNVSSTVPARPSVHSLFTGSWYYITVTFGWGTHFIEGSWTDYDTYLPAAQAAADAENSKPEYKHTTYVMASDGELLKREMLDNFSMTIPNAYDPEPPNIQVEYPWEGGSSVRLYRYDPNTLVGVYAFDRKLSFVVPEDAIGFASNTPNINFRTQNGDIDYAEINAYKSDYASGVLENNTRRGAWLKKNSDEFIAALKTGFAPNATGATRAELQTGKLPPSWEIRIKESVDRQYYYYPRDKYNIRVGRHTRRSAFSTAMSDTVQSDTSANLTQAGVKVTQRISTLSYIIPVVQPDGTTADETRTATVTSYLTQTVTRHNDAQGNNIYLSYRDKYENWYDKYMPDTTIPMPYTVNSDYGGDMTRVGAIVNGVIQKGYNADSSLGTPGSDTGNGSEPYYQIFYPTYPPIPVASSTFTATVPDFITTWHKDAKIEYLEDGVGASGEQNDSDLYGVKQIEITPVGLIADGSGNALAGTSLGIFSTGETGTQPEIYGTAVYNFDWQTGTLVFNKWKPLLDENGNEVASRVINLPAGTVFPISNSIITYKGLHWPDVINAIKERDKNLDRKSVV